MTWSGYLEPARALQGCKISCVIKLNLVHSVENKAYHSPRAVNLKSQPIATADTITRSLKCSQTAVGELCEKQNRVINISPGSEGVQFSHNVLDRAVQVQSHIDRVR